MDYLIYHRLYIIKKVKCQALFIEKLKYSPIVSEDHFLIRPELHQTADFSIWPGKSLNFLLFVNTYIFFILNLRVQKTLI